MHKTLEAISDYEIERGKPMPSQDHSITQANLLFQLMLHFRDKFRTLSEISLELPNVPQMTPDIAIFPSFQTDFRHDKIRITEPPITIIEILSPTQTLSELTEKSEKYFEAGVKSCWIVLPTFQTIYVLQSPTDFRAFTQLENLEDPATGITLQLREVFA